MTFRKIAIAFLLVVSMMVGLAGTIDVQAASKKTVRVATEKELKAALKNSSVGTVILRTGTYDPITISSKKAKKKKIIVDAPNSIITNKSVFKSVEILSARKYIEDVSGNKVSSDGKTQIEIAAGKSMKKLTFSNLSVDFVIRKGAAIKSLSYENEYVSSSFNSKTRELIYCDTLNSFMGKEYVKEYTLALDKSGRVLSISREGLSDSPMIDRIAGTSLFIFLRGVSITLCANATFSYTVISGRRRKSWNTIPIFLLCFAISLLFSLEISFPRTKI